MKPRRILLIFLGISLLLHLAVLGSGLLPVLSTTPPDDTPLRKVTVQLTKLALEPETPTTPAKALPSAQLHSVTKPGTPARKPAKPTQPEQAASSPQAEILPEKDLAQANLPDASAPQPAKPIEKDTQVSKSNASEVLAQTDQSPDQQGKGEYRHPLQAMRQFPQQAKLSYQGFYNKLMLGRAQLNWQRGDGQYQLELRIDPSIAGPKLRYRSEGRFSAQQGLEPEQFQAWMRDKPRESARILRQEQRILYGSNADQSTELNAGVQDIVSLAFQLSLHGQRLSGTPIQFVTGKKVHTYVIKASHEADFDTGDGKIRVLIFRAGGKDESTEFWLAPDFANLPVRIVRIDQGDKIDLRIHQIDVGGQRQLTLINPNEQLKDSRR